MAASKKIPSIFPWRRICIISGATFAIILGLMIVGLVYLSSESGRRKIIEIANESLASEESSIYISTIDGSLFSNFNIPLVSISDKEGIWLEAHNIDVIWSSLSMLSGEFFVSELAVKTINIMRLPAAPEEETPNAEPFTIPSLPIDVVVENYAISKINISDTLADIASEFKLNGTVKLTEGDGIIAKANLISTGNHTDAINIDVNFPGDASNLTANVNLSAPKDGLIIALIGLDPKEDISVKFNGAGPIENWSGRINAIVADDEVINALLTYVEGAFNLHADFDVRKFVPSKFSALIGETNSIDVNYVKSELSAVLTTKLAKLEANGAEMINFSFDLIDPEPINQLIAPAYVKATKINGIISNLTESPEVSVSINNLVAGFKNSVEATINGQMNASLKDQMLSFASSGSLKDINGDAVNGVNALLKDSINWNLNANLDQKTSTARLDAFSLTNDFIQINSVGDFNNESGAINADFEAVIASISNIAKSLDLDQNLAGEAFFNAKISRTSNGEPIDVKLVLKTENIDLDNPNLNELIGPTPTFISQISQSSDGVIRLTDTKFKAAILNFSAQADISLQQDLSDAGFILSFTNIENMKSMQGAALSGDIDVIGSVTGNLNSPSLLVETGFKALNIQNIELQDFVVKLNVDNILDGPNGVLSISSETNFGALDFATSFSRVNNNYQIPALNLSLGAYQANGAFELTDGKPVSGKLNVITRDIDQSDTGIRGDITADITLTDENNVQKIVVESALNGIIVPTSNSEFLTLKSGIISANALLMQNTPQITMDVSLNELMHPSFQSQLININVEQITDGLNYVMTVEGTNAMSYDIKLEGNMIAGEAEKKYITIGLEGMIGGTPIGFTQPAHIILQGDDVDISPFSLKLGEGFIRGNLNKKLNDVQAVISMDNANISPAMVFVPDMPLSGLLSGKMDFTSTETSLSNTFDFILSNIIFKDQDILTDNNFEITIVGTMSDKSTELSGKMGLKDYFAANYSAALPLKIDPTTFATDLADDQLINGEFNWQGDITPIWPLLQLVDHDFSGDLNANVTVGGTMREPDIDGKIIMTDGRYENMQTGFIAADMQIAATITDRLFTLDSFSANDGEEGTISATADINIGPDLSYSARADLILGNAKLVRQPELQITASSNLTFIKNQDNTSLSGDIIVENASIGSVEQGGPAIAKLDVIEINTEGTVVAKEQEDDQLGVIDLDLKILVPNQLFIQSFGLDSEWSADINITGTSEEPIIDGSADLIRGFFEFSGKRFDLKRGSFSFPNDKTNDPIIEIAAEHQLSDMIATLRIYGQASKPTLEMSATPYLPENEVLARILFGTSVTELTAVEAIQLASAVHSLSNGGGQGLLGGIRRAIGVDRLSIDNDSSREYGTTITGGKYLTNNIYVEVSTAPATGETATSVEVGLTRNLAIVTRRTLDHDNNLSIRWFWDY